MFRKLSVLVFVVGVQGELWPPGAFVIKKDKIYLIYRGVCGRVEMNILRVQED